jgi:hypothetical protein
MLRARWLLLVSVASMGCAATTPLQAEMLIYCDRSPGALADAVLWKSLAESEGPGATWVTEPGEFEAQLAAQAWERVVISARYAGGEPSYAPALRAFATVHPESMVHLFLWRDSGTQPTPDTAVMGTTSNFLWYRGMTIKSYRGAGLDTAPEARRTESIHGEVFPDFQGVEVENPDVLFRLPAAQAQGLSQEELIDGVQLALEGDDACLARCRLTWQNAIAQCDADFQADVAGCAAAYGPGAPLEDPVEYAKCVAPFAQAYADCLSVEGNRYNLCVVLCGLGLIFQRPSPSLP